MSAAELQAAMLKKMAAQGGKGKKGAAGKAGAKGGKGGPPAKAAAPKKEEPA